jgi:hypothetical protein
MSLKIRRGTDSERVTITPAEGELIYTTDTKLLYVGDGTTTGGRVVTASGGGTGYVGSQGDVGFTGSKGLQGDVGFVGSASTVVGYAGSQGYWGSVGYTGSGVPSGGTTGQVLKKNSNTDYDTIWGTVSGGGGTGGTLTSNLDTSTYSITNNSNLTINGSTGNMTANDLTIGNNTSSTGITLRAIGGKGITFKGIASNDIISVSGASPTFRIEASPNSPSTSLSSGNGVMSYNHYGADTNGNQIMSTQFISMVDNNEVVASDQVPGKFLFITCPNNNDYAALTFDSRGKLAVNQIDAIETLDVNGTGKFSGYVIFGSYTTTQRNALTPQNGMVIYNTTANKFQGHQNGSWINLDTGSAG